MSFFAKKHSDWWSHQDKQKSTNKLYLLRVVKDPPDSHRGGGHGGLLVNQQTSKSFPLLLAACRAHRILFALEVLKQSWSERFEHFRALRSVCHTNKDQVWLFVSQCWNFLLPKEMVITVRSWPTRVGSKLSVIKTLFLVIETPGTKMQEAELSHDSCDSWSVNASDHFFFGEL